MVDDSLDQVISEDEFRVLLEKEGADFFRSRSLFLGRESGAVFKRSFASILDAAHQLESFLDDFGARNNRTFAYFTEVVGVVRIFAGVGYILRHTLIRYPTYGLGDDRENSNRFHSGAEKILDFCNAVVQELLRESVHLAENVLKVGLPTGEAHVVATAEKMPKRHLPHNVDEKEVTTEEQFVPELATRVIRFADRFGDLTRDWVDGKLSITEFVDHGCSEERIRGFESAARAMQLKYDTVVKGTSREQQIRELRQLRGCISMSLHHLEMTGRALRYVERVSTGIKDSEIAKRLEALVDRKRLTEYLGVILLDRVLYYVRRARAIAERLLQDLTNVIEHTFDIPPNVQLHARPASLIVRIVNHYGTPVTLTIGQDTCDAGSIMRVMMTVGNNSGARQISFRGDEKPLRDIQRLFDAHLGENGLESLPGDLAYLKRI